MQTTGLSMHAVYDYHSYGPPTLRGYRVGQRAQVLVRDLATGGQAVSAAVRAGGNDVRVGDIGLRIADTDSLLARSRDAAVQEATAKAQEYADAAGQTLGPVLTLREVHATPVAPQYAALRAGGARLGHGRAADPRRQGPARRDRADRVVVRLSRRRFRAGATAVLDSEVARPDRATEVGPPGSRPLQKRRLRAWPPRTT